MLLNVNGNQVREHFRYQFKDSKTWKQRRGEGKNLEMHYILCIKLQLIGILCIKLGLLLKLLLPQNSITRVLFV